MTATAIGYRRVSSTEQVKGYSLQDQERTIREWCSRAGMPLLAIYDNESRGESGKDLERDGFQKVLDRIDQGGVTHVIVAKLDRLGRNFRDIAKLLEDWDERNIHLISIAEGITDSFGTNRTLIHILAEFAQMERERLIARVLPGMRARFDAGLPPTKVPFGYRIELAGSEPGAKPRLVPDPDTAPVVRTAFDLAAAKEWGSRRMAAALTLRNPLHPFTPGRVAHLLKDAVYTGVLIAQIGGSPCIRYSNHEPLITEALFAQVQQRMAGRRELAAVGVSASASSLLGGIANCARCGLPLVYRTTFPGQEEPVYCCSSRSRAGVHCGAGSAPIELLDSLAWAHALAGAENIRTTLREQYRQAIQNLPMYLDVRRQQAQACLALSEGQETDLLGLFERAQVSEEAFLAASKNIEVERHRQHAILHETDGWQYLERLHGLVPEKRRALLVPDAVAAAKLGLQDRRRLIAAACDIQVVLGPKPDVRIRVTTDVTAYAPLLKGFALALASDLVIDQEEAMRGLGYSKQGTRPDGCDVWVHPHGDRQVVRWIDGRLVKVSEDPPG